MEQEEEKDDDLFLVGVLLTKISSHLNATSMQSRVQQACNE
jgi:hypothetical protein